MVGDYPERIEIGGRSYVRTSISSASEGTGGRRVIYYAEENPVVLKRMSKDDLKAIFLKACEVSEEDYQPFGRLSLDRRFVPERGSRISRFSRPVSKAQRWIQLSQRVR